jgi:hypothetical protein
MAQSASNVDRIEPAAQADLEHDHVEPCTRRTPARPPACRTRNRSAAVSPRAVRRGEGGAQRRVVGRLAVDAHALVVAQQMRRGVEADAVAGASRMRSSMAQVEPLPLVPPT